MVQIKVISDFHDKFNFRIEHKVGEVFEVEEERAADLCARGLAETVTGDKPVDVSTEKPKAKEKNTTKAEGVQVDADSEKPKAKNKNTTKAEGVQVDADSEKEKSIKEAEEKLNAII